jgi:serine/threonine-protein kinase
MTPDRFRQIEDLYHSARERGAGVLADADPDLRREVESLLAQDPAREGMLDRPPGLVQDATVTTLNAGALLGPYKIEVPIGAGGMGEVYRAIDTRLGRKVAIKTLHQKFTDRFEREARAISALNHPHICTLYDVGPNYLVMELVEGETLAAKLKKGRLSIDDTLRYGGQIADALAAAHAKGIIHRDLKPGNVMVTKSGVKVLDFGLAKRQRDETLTGSHAVMGTPAYMAPEQIEGKEADARTDIYALGLVLREMATGQREGTTLGLPAPLAHVIDRCLATEPENRWDSAKDVKFELEWAGKSHPAAAPALAGARETIRRWWLVAAAALFLAVLGISIWGLLRTPLAALRPVTRWTGTLPPPPYMGPSLSISRDGTRLAYHGVSGNSSRIWVRSLDQPEGKPIPGTEGGLRPFFSPDGQWLAYLTGNGGALKKVPVTGGTPITLCDSAGMFGGVWGEDNRIIFSRSSGGLLRVSGSGGPCESLTTADEQKRELHTWPQILPGGQAVLFTMGTQGSFDSARIAVLDLKSRAIRILANGGMRGRYVPTGHLVYVRGGILFAVPFDLKRLAVTGSETPVIEGVHYNTGGGFADYVFSDSGLLVYSPDTRVTTLKTLQWLDRKGTPQIYPAQPQDYNGLRLSPDGRRAAVVIGFQRVDVWILDVARGALTRLTAEGIYSDPVWMPDSSRVVFSHGVDGTNGIDRALADGSSKPEALLVGQGGIADSWTPDGKTLLYESTGPSRIWSLQPLASGGDGKPRLLFEATSFNERDAQVSPDGRSVAYTSDESGKNRVYVRPFPGPGGKTPISIEGGQEPRWSRDGRELFYRDPEKNQLMAVDIQPSPAFGAGPPRALFALGDVSWDVAPDGKRFLVVKEPEATASEAKMQAVVNWFEELRQKAPKR